MSARADEIAKARRDAQWDDVAHLLGWSFIEWPKVESFLQVTFEGLSGMAKPVAVLVLRSLTGERLDKACKDLLVRVPPSDAEEIGAWLERVRELRKRRNDLAHGTFVNQYDGEAWLPANIRWRYDPSTGEEVLGGGRISPDDLAEFVADATEAMQEWTRLPRIAHGGTHVEPHV